MYVVLSRVYWPATVSLLCGPQLHTRSTQQHVTAARLDGDGLTCSEVDTACWWFTWQNLHHTTHMGTQQHIQGTSNHPLPWLYPGTGTVSWPVCLAASTWRDPSASHQHKLGSGPAPRENVGVWLLERAQVLPRMRGQLPSVWCPASSMFLGTGERRKSHSLMNEETGGCLGWAVKAHAWIITWAGLGGWLSVCAGKRGNKEVTASSSTAIGCNREPVRHGLWEGTTPEVSL